MRRIIITGLITAFIIFGMAVMVSASIAKNNTMDEINATMPIVTPMPYITDTSTIVNSTTPYLNALNPESPYYGKITMPKNPPANFNNITNTTRINTVNPLTGIYHIAWGTSINNQPNYIGVAAIQQILPTYHVPTGLSPPEILYAPTLIGSNYDPLEIAFCYNGSDSYNGGLYWGVFDQTDNTWRIFDSVDSTFLSKYVRNINGLDNAVEVCIKKMLIPIDGMRIYLIGIQDYGSFKFQFQMIGHTVVMVGIYGKLTIINHIQTNHQSDQKILMCMTLTITNGTK
jgi:hypothetical protein